jgi:hypothetical protein
LRLVQQIRSASWARKVLHLFRRGFDVFHFSYSLPRLMPKNRSKKFAVALLTRTRFV